MEINLKTHWRHIKYNRRPLKAGADCFITATDHPEIVASRPEMIYHRLEMPTGHKKMIYDHLKMVAGHKKMVYDHKKMAAGQAFCRFGAEDTRKYGGVDRFSKWKPA